MSVHLKLSKHAASHLGMLLLLPASLLLLSNAVQNLAWPTAGHDADRSLRR